MSGTLLSRVVSVFLVMAMISIVLPVVGSSTVNGSPTRSSAPQSDYVITPLGEVPKANVLPVPSGSTILADNKVRLPTGTVLVIPGSSARQVGPNLQSGWFWVENAAWNYASNGPPTLNTFSATWTVPKVPATNDGQVIYLFNGVQSSYTNQYAWILQPVLMWGAAKGTCNLGAVQGSNWLFTPILATSGGCIPVSPGLSAPPGAEVIGSMSGTSCSYATGGCNWEVTATVVVNGETTGTETLQLANMSGLAEHYLAITLESAGVTQCPDYPAGSIPFTGISVAGQNGKGETVLTPSWHAYYNDTSCGETVEVFSGSSVTLIVNPSGGCVAYGTPILTPAGYVQVQSLKVGQVVEEYNLSSHQMTVGTFLSGNTTNVTRLIDINNGLLFVTPTDQPIYIRNSTFTGWLRDPQNLTTKDWMFDPVAGQWIPVVSITLVQKSAVVYDVVTSNLNNFVANGALLDRKA
jgi:hypothetical protein